MVVAGPLGKGGFSREEAKIAASGRRNGCILGEDKGCRGMEFHISRAARERYKVDGTLFNYVGNVVFGDVLAARKLAARMSDVRQAEAQAGETAEVVNAGALFAMGLIDELSHAVIKKFRETVDPEVLPAALQWFASGVMEENVAGLLRAFTEQFPNTDVFQGKETVPEWLAKTQEGISNREAALEELMLLWLANVNPAYKPFKELFDDSELEKRTVYKTVTTKLPDYFRTRPLFSPEVGTLLDVLTAPMRNAPDSLSGQLDYIRENWVPFLGEELKAVLLAVDVLKEEEIAIWMRFHPGIGGGGWGQDGKRDWGMFGFSGDEYRGFDDLRSEEQKRRDWLASHGQPPEPVVHEYEAFSPDQAWMPTVVLIAKSTYVWLEQLSKQYKRHIHRLDQIPQEELQTLADRGMNGLWLIGLWERSVASQTIKRMRGQHDAVASAYSLMDYRIADDLGGNAAYEVLRERAKAAGIRLASDMVPNHMGIDSSWVVEHPDWFISRPESPFPVYRFTGPDLSPDGRVEIRLEDHYFDMTDAAVVFQLKQKSTGQTEYVFHGNDGTTFAWNDTAQLDYSKAYVREQVIQVILQVARQFPIIRFDAAMVLAKKHVQRLWFPLPGEGRSIPSRAENAMTQEEFDALMPHEFWREVVDRVAVEVPGTLLLAEAFWLLEGYFVRTLGMHRVYNSAFMNMLRDEENAKYRSYLKKTIEFDPDILKRYVNFMSNPDERTAVDQFGTGDKYFGCATLMATLPGLPMFGHGQVEFYTERYGMEYKQAKMDEWPNQDLVARHQREIMPLLKNRGLFAESGFFRMYDFNTTYNGVDENVFAFSNREGGRRAVILFNNAYQSTGGSIHWSVEQVDKGSGILRGETLGDAIQLPWEDDKLVSYKDTAVGLEYLRWSKDLRHNGLAMELRGYQYAVLLDWRELRASAEQPWDQLCNALNGAGVASVDEALSKLRVRAVHEAVRRMLAAEMVQGLVAAAAALTVEVSGSAVEEPGESATTAIAAAAGDTVVRLPSGVEAGVAPVVKKAEAFYQEAQKIGEIPAELELREELASSLASAVRLPGIASSVELGETIASEVLPDGAASKAVWAPVLAWSMLRHLGAEGKARVAAFDRLLLREALAESFGALGMDHEGRWRAAARVRVLLQYGDAPEAEWAVMTEDFWTDGDVGWLAGFSHSGGKVYLNKERLEDLLSWMTLPLLTQEPPIGKVTACLLEERLEAMRSAASSAGYEADVFLGKLQAMSAGKEKEEVTVAAPEAEPAGKIASFEVDAAVVEQEEPVEPR